MLKYCVSGLSCDKDGKALPWTRDFGTFDDEDSAFEKFTETFEEANADVDLFFLDNSAKIKSWIIRIEKCVFTDVFGLEHIDSLLEETIPRPIKKKSRAKYKKGEVISSLDDLVQCEYVYFMNKVYHNGWFNSWQIGWVKAKVENRMIFRAELISKEGKENDGTDV